MKRIMIAIAFGCACLTECSASAIYPGETYPAGYEYIKSGWPVASGAVSDSKTVESSVDLFSWSSVSQVLKDLYAVPFRGLVLLLK